MDCGGVAVEMQPPRNIRRSAQGSDWLFSRKRTLIEIDPVTGATEKKSLNKCLLAAVFITHVVIVSFLIYEFVLIIRLQNETQGLREELDHPLSEEIRQKLLSSLMEINTEYRKESFENISQAISASLPGMREQLDHRLSEEIRQKLLSSLLEIDKEHRKESFENISQAISASLPGTCPILYNGNCYWAAMGGEGTTNYVEGELLCRERGGCLAKVHDDKQMKMMLEYARHWFPLDSDNVIAMWINGKYNPDNGTLVPRPQVRWRPGYPSRAVNNVRMNLVSSEDQSNEGYANVDPNVGIFGAFCQNLN